MNKPNTPRLLSLILLFLGIVSLAGIDSPVHAADSSPSLVVSKFALEIEGKVAGVFLSVTGIGSETEIIEVIDRDTNGQVVIRKIPGHLNWMNVELKRAFINDLFIADWRQLVIDGRIDEARINFSIIAYNEANEEIARWSFTNGWPSKLTYEPVSTIPNYVEETLVLSVDEGYSCANDASCYPEDLCPDDPLKTAPGICGCGIADGDSDLDRIADCQDDCPFEDASDQDVDGDGCIDNATSLPEVVEDLQLPQGSEKSLTSKATNIQKSISTDKIKSAKNKIDAFINQVEAQSKGKNSKISTEDAAKLIEQANNLKNSF